MPYKSILFAFTSTLYEVLHLYALEDAWNESEGDDLRGGRLTPVQGQGQGQGRVERQRRE